MEQNFGLFFGLAIQMYQSRLGSDRAPFDRFMEGDDDALSAEQLRAFSPSSTAARDGPTIPSSWALGRGTACPATAGPSSRMPPSATLPRRATPPSSLSWK